MKVDIVMSDQQPPSYRPEGEQWQSGAQLPPTQYGEQGTPAGQQSVPPPPYMPQAGSNPQHVQYGGQAGQGQPVPPYGYGGQAGQGQPVPPYGYGGQAGQGQPVPPYGYGGQAGQGQPYGSYYPQAAEPGSGQAIAGLILGIVSIVICWIPGFGFIIGIVGLIMSVLGRRSVSRRVLATVGLVLSIIGIVFSLCDIGLIIYAIIHAAQSTQ